ncbi:MAG: cache domain-containing protein [Rhodobacteraceae bacterium]|nr:cache domain-containing protein [Paracoccaceae bacterium]
MPEDNPRPLIPWNKSVRARLLFIALLPMFLVMPLFGGVVIYNWSQRFDDLLIAKVNGELTIAHQYLASLKVRSFENLQALGASAAFSDAQITGTLGELLEAERQKYGFDFLYLINPDGAIIMANALNAPATPEKWPIVKSALDGGGGAEIDLFQVDELASISPQLVVQANIPLVPTKAAVPTNRTQETRGMVVHSAAPATAGQGALVAGVLLNQNLDFIDSINALVYPEASLTEGSLGTTTLFLDDVRISTNVRLFEDVRALGTRVSKEVRAAVLDDGRTWLDRAFVVNDWYISGYEPLVDSFGTRIGMLYVGFLDSPYRAAKAQTLWLIAVGFLLLLGLSVPLLLRLARGIFRPLEEMVSTISAVEAGNLSARTGLENTENEVSLVSAQLDTLLDNVQERDQRLREWADELETRVAARTRELSDANQRLEATTKQLVVSGKLAAIGEITASVAHEINNPVAVIQGNTDLIRESIGSASKALNTEFSLIYEQVHRINTLVNKLLQFARPEEYAGSVDRHSPNAVITDTLPLVQYLLNKVEIELDLQLMAGNLVSFNRTELQQVLINLIVNAIHAMPDGGTLKISTADYKIEDQEGVLITIADTGMGMTPEVLSRMFDPFYTTKRAEGTGLGLSITHKLITRSGGQIWAESQLRKGSIFRVHLLKAE